MLANDMCKIKHERSKSKSTSASKKTSQKIVEDSKQNSPESISDLKGEPDFIETNCHWKNCNLEYQTQAVLVQVHIIIIIVFITFQYYFQSTIINIVYVHRQQIHWNVPIIARSKLISTA